MAKQNQESTTYTNLKHSARASSNSIYRYNFDDKNAAQIQNANSNI